MVTLTSISKSWELTEGLKILKKKINEFSALSPE